LTEILGAVQPRFDLATLPLLTQPLLVWAPLASFEQVSRYAMNHAVELAKLRSAMGRAD
jgi:hypothetical protein